MAELIRKIGIDYLIVWLPDRLSRNTADMNVIIELIQDKNKIRKGVITESCDYEGDNNDHRLNLEQRLFDAKRENQNKSERTKKSQTYQKITGIYPHQFPFGYTNLVD
jgi:DNA invertase Pin-like site-specific DNA recombinase